jgi:ribosome biogenesis protein BRX1
MASLLKASTELNNKKGKGKSQDAGVVGTVGTVSTTGDEVEKVKRRKDKVLLLSSRGVTQRMRHLMHDLEALLPHTKKGECGV